ncbi:MAG: ExbD/TolR family protein [Ramlibacter sp.]|nr:ExbD/TolR family protein [Ramlibacter sp.]
MPHVAARGRGRRTMNEINMVPFIDVMLVLLIIFMVDLPSVGKASKQPDQVVQVIVAKDETLQLKSGDKTLPMNLKDIAPAVLRAQSGQVAGSVAVVISADRSVKYETVVKVMDTLQRAGVQRVGLSVQLAP